MGSRGHTKFWALWAVWVTGANYQRNVSDEDKQLEVKKEVVVDVKQYSGVELIIKSGFGSTLPSKDDLIRTYEKFGALDKERSCTFENDSCARVSFLNVSEGEEAFYESLEKCPFATTSTVTFSSSILLLRTERGWWKWSGWKRSLKRALLDESEGGEVTEKLKMRLEEESRNLLDKVTKMTCLLHLSCLFFFLPSNWWWWSSWGKTNQTDDDDFF